MTIKSNKNIAYSAVLLASAVALSGCTGTSTYGTGKSQERQLFDDITGIVSLGGGKKKERIDYSSRSGLVKPPSRAELPAPAESIQGGDGYFPEDAETKRKRVLAAIDEAEANGTELPPEVAAARRESAAVQRPNVEDMNERGGVCNTWPNSTIQLRLCTSMILVFDVKTNKRGIRGYYNNLGESMTSFF